ncbi:MAG: PilZ domain-containing protein [Candidatus Omnitrophota bacterium]
MFTLVGLFFILLLSMILYMLYRTELTATKNNRHHAKVEEYWTGKERRKYTRFKKTLDVIYTVAKKPHLSSRGHTIDISEGGMKLVLDEKLPKGAIMDLKISIPGSSQDTDVEGEIIWSEEANYDKLSGKRQFYYGIKFLYIKEPSGKHLSDYIRSISVQP